MELKFDNKLTEKQILLNANKIETRFEMEDNTSILGFINFTKKV